MKMELIMEQPEPAEAKMINGIYTIKIEGEIGFEVTAQAIRKQLEDAGDQEVMIRVSSPGGSVFEGIEIFNAIRDYPGKTTAHIVGLAASMGSYIPLACDYVKAEDNAIYMIHNAWGVSIGNHNELAKRADFLKRVSQMFGQEYAKKTGKKIEEIYKLMDAESWYFGVELKEMGFVDEIVARKKYDKKEKMKDELIADAQDEFQRTTQKMNESTRKIDMKKTEILLSEEEPEKESGDICEQLQDLCEGKL
jgi:ATP-dependent Clp endopeptidase proteolytic subunit ClpP